MTTFTGGPAAGVSLMLRRAPLFLRVVVGVNGEFDALDQLADTPADGETVYAYRRVGDFGSLHIDRRDGKTGRRIGEWYTTAEYEFVPDQPSRAVLGETGEWRAWCESENQKRKAG